MSAALEGILEAELEEPGFAVEEDDDGVAGLARSAGVAGSAGFDGSVAEGSVAVGSVAAGSADGSTEGSAAGSAEGSPEVEELAAAALAASTFAVLILPMLITDVTETAMTQSNAVTHWITVFFISYLPQSFEILDFVNRQTHYITSFD